MALGGIFKSLFGGGTGAADGSKQSGDPVEYKGFIIVATPIKEGGQFRTAGSISKTIDGETRQVQYIRADNNGDLQAAIDHSIYKGKQIIDEQGEAVLQRENA